MANVLKREKQEQIKALGRLGWSLRRIEDEIGVRRETVSRYLKRAGIPLREPRGRRLAREPKAASQVPTDPRPNSKAASQVPTDLDRGSGPGVSAVASSCEPYRELVQSALDRGRNATAIWQTLVDEYGFAAGYDSVKRFVRKLRGEGGREAHPRIETKPGEEAQVDYGTGPMVRDPVSGRYRRTRLFALTLGYSRKSVWLLCFKSSSQQWCELHEEAFRRLGGLPEWVVLDNLKEGVIKPDVYDPELNPLYRDMLAHYGVVAIPARVRHPDRKGKVERAVGHAQGTPLQGMRFETLDDAQAHLDQWSERWADTRIHGTTKRQVAAMFCEEKPSLKALPLEPFRYYRHGARVVHLDGCVEVEAAYYSLPPGWIGKRVTVQWNHTWVRILDPHSGELVREHRTKPRGWRTVHPSDRPPKTPIGTLRLLSRANSAGASIGLLCEEIHRRNGQAGVRRIQGVLSLAKKHGVKVTEDACKAAMDMCVPDYRFVRRWIERHPTKQLTLRQVDPLIRELTQYRNLIGRMTGTEES